MVEVLRAENESAEYHGRDRRGKCTQQPESDDPGGGERQGGRAEASRTDDEQVEWCDGEGERHGVRGHGPSKTLDREREHRTDAEEAERRDVFGEDECRDVGERHDGGPDAREHWRGQGATVWKAG
jgi:hypothetical protein